MGKFGKLDWENDPLSKGGKMYTVVIENVTGAVKECNNVTEIITGVSVITIKVANGDYALIPYHNLVCMEVKKEAGD